MRVAPGIVLDELERETLNRWARGENCSSRLALRAQIILASGDGRQNKDIARQLGICPKTVSLWRRRFRAARLAGIEKDAPRGGRPPTMRTAVAQQILDATFNEPPSNGSHWTTRSLAARIGVSPSMVQRVWRANSVQVKRPAVTGQPEPLSNGQAHRRPAPAEQADGGQSWSLIQRDGTKSPGLAQPCPSSWDGVMSDRSPTN